eukprot:gnl/TRDRNA2_/TRDRNA2_37325_c2_seq1.p3 gnl/TRDRNA2_/TRDRNA2_37325_c2~~gnl/TRDRNA2_/TRDRNA2_37325_c2_seq1.p3  ORF type:complete len:106 (+),score=13.00 gnl/TRDRNA2_/TRDRNA2_37325_c2_seq1:198-515(+)
MQARSSVQETLSSADGERSALSRCSAAAAHILCTRLLHTSSSFAFAVASSSATASPPVPASADALLSKTFATSQINSCPSRMSSAAEVPDDVSPSARGSAGATSL